MLFMEYWVFVETPDKKDNLRGLLYVASILRGKSVSTYTPAGNRRLLICQYGV